MDFAIQKKPAVIFFDNITDFIGSRGEYKGQLLNILNQIEKNEGIILIGTALFPWEIDTGFLSRFQKKLYIPLPNFEAKKAILKFNIKDTSNTLTEEQIEDIIKRTDPLVGGDVVSLTQQAISYPVWKCKRSEYFKKIPGINGQKFNYVPCTENEPGAIKMKMNEIPKDELPLVLPPKVEYKDFINADKSITCKGMGYPTFKKEIEQLEEFTKQYGIEG